MTKKTNTKRLIYNPDRDYTIDELIAFFEDEFHPSGAECVGGVKTRDIIRSLKIIEQKLSKKKND